MDHGFTFRPRTQDADAFDQVVIQNEYRLPESLADRDLILDIGMNIGSFCYAALTRGAGEVHGFEPEPANYECATRNLRQFGARIHLHHGAVWRSDRSGHRLRISHRQETDWIPTACSHVLSGGGMTEVPTFPLDDLIRDVTGGGARRIGLMKVDCEGSEYPILFTSRMLHLIDEIIGEYHNFQPGTALSYASDHPCHRIPDEAKVSGFDRYTGAELVAFLRRSGYRVTAIRNPARPDNMGWFFARRDRAAAAGLRGKVRGIIDRLGRRKAS